MNIPYGRRGLLASKCSNIIQHTTIVVMGLQRPELANTFVNFEVNKKWERDQGHRGGTTFNSLLDGGDYSGSTC